MFKRPTLRPPYNPRPYVPKRIPNDSYLYQFVRPNTIIPYTSSPFVAHWDYEFIARKNNDPEFLERSLKWYQENPTPVTVVPTVERVDNSDALLKLMKTYYPHPPPIDAMVAYMEGLNYSDARIQKYINTMQRRQSLADKHQEMIDSIFGKYSLKSKPDKKVKKVIKAVKKKIV